MGKNKNRGERAGRTHERGTAVQTEEHTKSPATQEQVQIHNPSEPVSHKRRKRFGHN